MKTLVTGATGFLGSHLVRELLKRGYHIRCLVLPGDSLPMLDHQNVEIVKGDVSSIDTLYDVVRNIDYVFHLAGVKGTFYRSAYHQINVLGTKNIVRAIMLTGNTIRKLVFPSSQAASGPSLIGRPLIEDDPCHPIDLYGKSKLLAENYLFENNHNIPFSILRFSPCYGPGNLGPSMIGIVLKLTQMGIMPLLLPNTNYIQMLHVGDAVRALLMAAESTTSGEAYFITSPRPYTWEEVGKICFRIRKKNGRIIPISEGIARLGIKSAKWYRSVKGLPVEGLEEMANYVFQRYWVCDGSKAKLALGFVPQVSIEEGLTETIQWFDRSRS